MSVQRYFGKINIPSDWQVKKLSDITDKIWIGLVTTMTTHYVDSGTPLIRNSNIKENKIEVGNIIYLDNDFAERNKDRSLKRSDVVTVHTGDIGTSSVIPNELDGAQGFATLNTRVSDGLLPKYLSYFFNSYLYKNQAYSVSTGDGRNNLNMKDFVKSLILVPPPEEQKKIAQILSTWDESIETIEKLIEKKKKLLKSLLNDYFSEKSKYHKDKLKNLGTFSRGKGIAKKEILEQGLPCVRYGELYTDFETGIKTISSFINSSSAKKSTKIKFEDILIAGSGETAIDIGKSAIYLLDEGYVGSDIIIFSPNKKKVNPRFLSFQLSSPYQIKQRARLAQGNSVVHIYKSHLEKIDILLPSLEKQISIAETFDNLESIIQLLFTKKHLLQQQKKGLIQRLLAGKVRVN